MPKRENYISWDEYFMGISLLSSMRSKDPSTQVGACIVSDDNKIMSVGYNGFPRGCSDDEFPWERSAENANETKYPFVCHAELNAILNAGGHNLSGSRIFVALFPCNECAKAIIQSGIKEVVYISDKYSDTDGTRASKRMLNSAGVKLTKFKSDSKQITISFNEEDV
ncbi:dCMP deaminase family protein [uncultured Eubacterium sp.]|uniref:deoxycytidylate deaminase n=1 Tax=uncultured Eubacterium sp. TaxID=165185 RepID=UPI002804ACEB|nr:dCMP deaminase family protein [uncultured Eubacterium sp.]